MFFGIVQPEVVALRVGVRNMCAAHSLHLVKQRWIGKSGTPQFRPIIPSATQDHVVNGGERKTLVVKVAVEHA